jgi:hypothetical protein
VEYQYRNLFGYEYGYLPVRYLGHHSVLEKGNGEWKFMEDRLEKKKHVQVGWENIYPMVVN